MRTALVLVIALAGCGRIGFDPLAGDASGDVPPSNLRYDRVLPVYITGYAMPALTPTVTGIVTGYAIAPALPPGMQIDPLSGVLTGTPTVAVAAAPYTVTARNAAGQTSTTIRIRTADGYIVNDSGDVNDMTPGDATCETVTGNALCTLRAATTEINAAGGTKNVIYIPAQTIIVPSNLAAALQSMELVGEATTATILDGSTVSILSFGANNVSLTLSYLTYRNSSTIDHNFRTGITLIVDHVLVTGCAGFAALATDGTITMTDSTFDTNSVNVMNASTGPVTIERCSFLNNSCGVDGLLYYVFGGGSLTNSTFTNNSGQASPVVNNNATLTVAHNTFAGNTATDSSRGGAFTQYSGGTSTWTNNLLANNNGPSGNCSVAGTLVSGGGNLGFPDSSSCLFDTAGDLAVDPLVRPLADNGGPTLTIALGAGSPAIDAAATAGCPATDQRGVARPLGTACDIGAVEQQ
ncbi:MAG TPA: right-handed parallel beta-helix repeat-containing protein [Kofleriaceae bacterium]|nr:right-handed parallel beta-helix repeat-containing protein [Kofleriaceae bacterium]